MAELTEGEKQWLDSEERIVNEAVRTAYINATIGLRHDYRRYLLESAIVMLQSQRVHFPVAQCN